MLVGYGSSFIFFFGFGKSSFLGVPLMDKSVEVKPSFLTICLCHRFSNIENFGGGGPISNLKYSVWHVCLVHLVPPRDHLNSAWIMIPGFESPRKERNSRFFRTLLWINSYPFSPCSIDSIFSGIDNNTKVINICWELFILWVIS